MLLLLLLGLCGTALHGVDRMVTARPVREWLTPAGLGLEAVAISLTSSDAIPLAARWIAVARAAAAGNARLWVVAGAGHVISRGDGLHPVDADYRRSILAFLADVLR